MYTCVRVEFYLYLYINTFVQMPVEARGGGAWLEQELQTVVLRIEFWSSVSDCTIRAEKSLQLFLKTFEVDIRSFNKCFFF